MKTQSLQEVDNCSCLLNSEPGKILAIENLFFFITLSKHCGITSFLLGEKLGRSIAWANHLHILKNNIS